MVKRGRNKGGKVNPIHFWPFSYRYEVALLAVYSPFLSLAGNEGGGRRWVGWEEKREAAAGGGGISPSATNCCSKGGERKAPVLRAIESHTVRTLTKGSLELQNLEDEFT